MHKYLHFEILACDQQKLRATPGYESSECATKTQVERFFDSHIMIGYMANTFVNKMQFEKSPIDTLSDMLFYEQLSVGENIRKEIQLNYNEVELKDSFFLIWEEHQTEESNFISLDHTRYQTLRTLNPTAYF